MPPAAVGPPESGGVVLVAFTWGLGLGVRLGLPGNDDGITIFTVGDRGRKTKTKGKGGPPDSQQFHHVHNDALSRGEARLFPLFASHVWGRRKSARNPNWSRSELLPEGQYPKSEKRPIPREASWTAAVICRFGEGLRAKKRQRTGALQKLAHHLPRPRDFREPQSPTRKGFG